MSTLHTEEKRALCQHYEQCGGCQAQDVPYEKQLEDKEAQLRELFQEYWNAPIPVDPSPVLWNYRNKVDPNFGGKHYDVAPPKDFQRECVLGFKQRGRWYGPFELNECLIGPEGFSELVLAVRSWHKEKNYFAFNSRSKKGLLRVLLVRAAKRTGERMVVLVTADGDLDADSFVQTVQAAFPSRSIHRAIFRGLADVAAADELFLLDGEPTITEELHVPTESGDPRILKFRLSPFSFFQTNTLGAELLYGKIRKWVADTAPRTLYDLYGGMGSIAFACSDLVERVESVENVPEASEDGRFNAEVNGISNVTFHTEKMKNYLRNLIITQGEMPPDAAVVVDPPRAGLHPKALRRLIELGPRHLLYVACKPAVLAKQEMETLSAAYNLTGMSAVDMFPHTKHVELIARFEKKQESSLRPPPKILLRQ